MSTRCNIYLKINNEDKNKSFTNGDNLLKKENEFFKQYNPEYGQFHNDGLLFSVNNFE